jgi:hypothetical protein
MVPSTVCQEKRDYSVLLRVALVSGKTVKVKLIQNGDIFSGYMFEIYNVNVPQKNYFSKPVTS